MSVLPPPLGRDSPMSIERIAPASQFHSQNPNISLQNAHHDRHSPPASASASANSDGDGDGDGDIQMRSLDDRQPPSSACTLFLALGLFLFRVPHPNLFNCANAFANGPGSPRHPLRKRMTSQPSCICCTTELLRNPMTSPLPPFRSVPITHSHHTSLAKR